MTKVQENNECMIFNFMVIKSRIYKWNPRTQETDQPYEKRKENHIRDEGRKVVGEQFILIVCHRKCVPLHHNGFYL
jgi:hypothetical protein